ncbi:MAG TPA: universal stress protein [Rhizobiales bacterium]|nr:universal stress protein [Hyphomicrobiales bacterium]
MSDSQMNETQNHKFNILVCIDGSEESYRGLHYAIKFSLDHADTDISLLYVRPDGTGERSSGLNMDLARDNMLEWNLELPGLKSLKRARDMLRESGFLGDDWNGEDITKKFRGSRSSDHVINYVSAKTGQSISLIVRESSSVLTGILDEAHFYHYDIVIVSASSESAGGLGHIDAYTAISVATEHDGTVILVRELEEGHGHFVCVEDTERSREMVHKDAVMAQRCDCPITLFSVAEDVESLDKAQHAIDMAEKVVLETGNMVTEKLTAVGDPVRKIIEKGSEYSLIVISATEKSTLKRMFLGSVSHAILKKAKNSVMIVR